MSVCHEEWRSRGEQRAFEVRASPTGIGTIRPLIRACRTFYLAGLFRRTGRRLPATVVICLTPPRSWLPFTPFIGPPPASPSMRNPLNPPNPVNSTPLTIRPGNDRRRPLPPLTAYRSPLPPSTARGAAGPPRRLREAFTHHWPARAHPTNEHRLRGMFSLRDAADNPRCPAPATRRIRIDPARTGQLTATSAPASARAFPWRAASSSAPRSGSSLSLASTAGTAMLGRVCSKKMVSR